MSAPAQHHHTPHMEQPVAAGNNENVAHGRLKLIWDMAIKLQVSDVIIRPGNRVKLRMRGELKNVDAPPFEYDEMEREVRQMLNDAQWTHYNKAGSIDLAYAHDPKNRFRVNIFRTMGRSAIAARRISSDIKNFDELYLPPVMADIANNHQGLVLLCGVTGSGKSTTIAAMIDKINAERPCHILTLEDPIEYMFPDKKALINQREIGLDVPNFAEGLRAMVRENPDVVLIGELRDRETFEAAVHAAETGHLCFGTVHASSCAQCFSRIYNLFPPEERELIREMFAQTLKAIVYQKLVKTLLPEVARMPAVEVLLNTPIVTKYIFDSREAELTDVIKKSESEGMMDLNSCLVNLVNKEYIHPKVALETSRNPDELRMLFKGIRSGAGVRKA